MPTIAEKIPQPGNQNRFGHPASLAHGAADWSVASVGARLPSGSAFQRSAALPESADSLADDLVAGRITEAQVSLGAKRAARDRCEFFLVEVAIAEIEILQPEARNVREEVKRTLGQQAGDAGNFIELRMQQFPAAIEGRQHG